MNKTEAFIHAMTTQMKVNDAFLLGDPITAARSVIWTGGRGGINEFVDKTLGVWREEDLFREGVIPMPLASADDPHFWQMDPLAWDRNLD